MHYASRTIAFLCELLHPPQVPAAGPIQRVHNRLFGVGGTPVYGSFNVSTDGAVLSNPLPQPGAVSSAAFLTDRFQFREELTGITLDDFVQRLEQVTRMVLDEVPVPMFTAQAITVRTLVNPRAYRDSRLFLKDGMFHMHTELASFGREPQLLGVRLVFPPTQEEPFAFTLRVESFASDPRSLFLENTGSFGPVVPTHGLAPIGTNVRRTYDFLVERALPFLAQFDQRTEA